MKYSRQLAADDGITREKIMDEVILARLHHQELALMKKHNLIHRTKKLGNQGKCGNVRLNYSHIKLGAKW
jgi:hypothetical protein